MRVLMFGWEFPPHNSGGLGVACLGLTNGLASEDIEVLFVLPKNVKLESDKIEFLYADRPDLKKYVTFKVINSPIHPYITPESYLSKVTKDGSILSVYGDNLISEVLRYGAVAGEVAKENEFDVIHAHDWLSFGAGISAKKSTGKPLIVHIHATEFDRSAAGVDPIIFELEKQGFKEADKIVAVSDYTKRSVVKNYGINPEKIEVVHNGVDSTSMLVADSEHPSILKLQKAGNKVVLFLGRLTSQKAPDYFLRAAKKVLEYNPNIVFMMAGAGDMEDYLHTLTEELGISDKVIFPGFIRGIEKAQIYKSADLYVMPSASEPFGLVALESVVNGTPVLISNQSGVAEVLKHSLRVDFWDIDDMANKILAVITHTSLQDNLQTNSFKELPGLSWSKAAQKMKGIYRQLVKS